MFCDFFVVVTATFRTLYVFVIMELGTRKILHHNLTAHPTAEWTLQQFREALPGGDAYRYLIHDRDSIFFARELDKQGNRHGRASIADSDAGAKGDSVVRTFRRDVASRMPGVSASVP
jgi:hypothetical protein